jgi:2-hydroxy-3-keto-5-methylthiopentenyl-1-phosphate phosphatase
MDHLISRRAFGRVKFNEPIISTIELITPSFNDRLKATGEIEIVVIDMSAGGLKFVSKLEFTVNYLAIYKIRIVLESKNLELNGKIVRKRKLTNQFYEYGVQFDYYYDHLDECKNV